MRIVGLLLVALLGSPVAYGQDEFEREPIQYSQSQPGNAISQLQERLERGEAKLDYEDHFGYLRSVLRELQVPASSQTLVFSKTSLQRQKIAPRVPRSLYFKDDLYLGFCQNGDVLEISAVDPKLGTVFYTLEQEPADKPKFVRQLDNCLICHASSNTQNVPGHVLRSVYTDVKGAPILSGGTFRIDYTSEFKKRWGGWYVTGTHGQMPHLGNLILKTKQVPEAIDNSAGHNVTDLAKFLDTKAFLTPHSDIVALMVLEHQTILHNLIVKANFQTRQALHYQGTLNRELKQPADQRWESVTSRIKNAGEPLLKGLLFCDEAEITAPVVGTSKFSEEFAAQGPRDKQGRSLREFDLARRMFKYPCSYLIYSEAFDALPKEVRDYTLERLHAVLTGEDQSPDFKHLNAADRLAILEILRDTKADLPEAWHAQ
jgi:hypothetical protein